MMAFGDGASFLANALLVWRFTQAPIGVVTALRETSIVFALSIGVTFLKERLNELAMFRHCATIEPRLRASQCRSPRARAERRIISEGRVALSEPLHPNAPHHLPSFITAPGDTDVLMIVVGILLIAAVLAVGNLYLHLHTLPERMAHRTQKLQFEIVAVLGLLALFTHNHLFWVIGLFLAMVDLPDFGTPLRRIAGSVEKMAGVPPEPDPAVPAGTVGHTSDVIGGSAKSEVQGHA